MTTRDDSNWISKYMTKWTLNLWSDGMVEFLKVGGMGFESLVFGDG
jgi:hypothetical protein